jgi:hypothetical protein
MASSSTELKKPNVAQNKWAGHQKQVGSSTNRFWENQTAMHLQRIDQKIEMIEAKREELQKNNKYQANIKILQNTPSTLANYKQGLEIYSNTSATPNVTQHQNAQLNLSVNLERLRVRKNGTTHE